MEFCYLIIIESTKIGKIDPIIIKDDDPKEVEKIFIELNYKFDKPLKRRIGFSKLYKDGSTLYYKVLPCLKINNKFYELREIVQ